MAWRRLQDAAATSTVGLLIGAATFGVAFAAANLMVEKPGGTDHGTAQLDHTASTALDLIISQPGRATGGGAWTADADLIDRFGLAKADQASFLDYVKIKSMRNATMYSVENNAPDYEDVREALGVDDRDFHLRTYPVIPGLDDPRWAKDPRGRLAYFAHYSGAIAPGSMVSFVNDTDRALNVSLAIRNDGLAYAIFTANVVLGARDSNEIFVDEQRHTRLLAPGEVQTVWVEFPRLQSWHDRINGVRVDLTDSYGNTLVPSYWISATPPEGGTQQWGVTLHGSQVYYVSGATVRFTGDHFNGDGAHTNQDQDARFVLVSPAGVEMVNQTLSTFSPAESLPKGKNKVWTYECDACDAVGNYTARLWTPNMKYNASDVVHVSAERMFDEKKTIDPLATKEISLLKDLVVQFNGLEHDADTFPEGDVFGDDQNGPNEVAEVLDRYSTLVIGSEVSQTSLNSATTKYAIAAWVQAGGNLIVLGTERQQSNWLEPIYHAAQITANGGIGTPDPTHPVLSSPNKLDYQRYLDRGRAWDIDSDQPFTHVLTRSPANGDSMHDTLAISAPGAYNDGTVVLTSYMPASITSPQDDVEAKRFLHNLLSQSYNMLFLDFGPPIPDKTPVGSAQRLVAVPHPNVPGAVVEVRIVMYAWS